MPKWPVSSIIRSRHTRPRLSNHRRGTFIGRASRDSRVNPGIWKQWSFFWEFRLGVAAGCSHRLVRRAARPKVDSALVTAPIWAMPSAIVSGTALSNKSMVCSRSFSPELAGAMANAKFHFTDEWIYFYELHVAPGSFNWCLHVVSEKCACQFHYPAWRVLSGQESPTYKVLG